MCKRYFVEVTGLGEDGETLLQEAGVRKSSILVVDEDVRNKALVSAIMQVTGIGFDEIRSQRSSRYVVAARTMYVHIARMMGDSVGRIGQDIGRSDRYVRWYDKDFVTKMDGDLEFKRDAERVIELVEIVKREGLKPSRRKRSRKKKRGGIRKVPLQQNINDDKERRDKRQLTIDFQY